MKAGNSLFFLTSLLVGLLSSDAVFAQAPKVGREAAAGYFQRRSPTQEVSSGPADHYLALHVGRFMSSEAWEWGQSSRKENVGSNTFGLTYRMYEWSNSMDLAIRVDFTEYNVADEKPLKMSFLPMLMFPDATSRFPLYFGGGIGMGVFFKQIKDKSPLALDYQLIVGARFFDVFENVGFFVETGLKNQLLLTSSGQFNGVFLSGGAVFTF